MTELDLAAALAVEIHTSNPAITAHLTPLTVFPAGIAFDVVAEKANAERGQAIPYFVSARLRVGNDEYEIGGGTQASATMARVSFWLALSKIEGGIDILRQSHVAIDFYEGHDRQTATTNRTLVQTVTIDIP